MRQRPWYPRARQLRMLPIWLLIVGLPILVIVAIIVWLVMRLAWPRRVHDPRRRLRNRPVGASRYRRTAMR